MKRPYVEWFMPVFATLIAVPVLALLWFVTVDVIRAIVRGWGK